MEDQLTQEELYERVRAIFERPAPKIPAVKISGFEALLMLWLVEAEGFVKHACAWCHCEYTNEHGRIRVMSSHEYSFVESHGCCPECKNEQKDLEGKE